MSWTTRRELDERCRRADQATGFPQRRPWQTDGVMRRLEELAEIAVELRSDIDDLEERVENPRDDDNPNADHDSRIDAAENTIDDLERRVSDLETA